MAAPNWSKLPPVIEDLLANAPAYGLFPALAAVECAWGARGQIGNGLDRWVRVEPHPGLSFPPADLRGGRLDERGVLRLQANVYGLYGVDAPVPHYLLDAAGRADEVGARFRAFLDLFNHRLYSLLYQAWKLRAGAADPDGPYQAVVRALAGAAAGDGAAHAAGLGRRRISAAALATVVRTELREPASVADRLPQWLPVPERRSLGAEVGPRLGEDALLGDGVQVAGERIDVRIGPLALQRALGLLPGAPAGRRLLALLRGLLGPEVPFDIVLRVRPGAAAAPALGVGALPLGWSAWLGERLEDDLAIRITAGREPARPASPGSG